MGENDPYDDILFLEREINLWFKQILEREDWDKFLKSHAREKKSFIEELYKRLSGIKVNRKQINQALKTPGLEEISPSLWSDKDLLSFSKILREKSKPIVDIPAKVGFLLELLDIEPIGLAIHFPVDVTDIIPGHVLAVFGEFHRKPMIRAFVQANNEALHHQPGLEFHTGQFADRSRIEEFAVIFCHVSIIP